MNCVHGFEPEISAELIIIRAANEINKLRLPFVHIVRLQKTVSSNSQQGQNLNIDKSAGRDEIRVMMRAILKLRGPQARIISFQPHCTNS